ncbi:unnamed protein product [Chrysodeixis includens]|uniref:Uncharacterized protein n=1 Tax=Chrysodeixis includens TaxID=689277 RepID=A0A9N8KRV1_CHRIL|nr:unnamed protein product [Chrysodeixis includens]
MVSGRREGEGEQAALTASPSSRAASARSSSVRPRPSRRASSGGGGGGSSGFSSVSEIACQKVNIVDILYLAAIFTVVAIIVAQLCRMARSLASEGEPRRAGSRASSRASGRASSRASGRGCSRASGRGCSRASSRASGRGCSRASSRASSLEGRPPRS